MFQPILDARTKAERLRSTLGVFERSKFFFNLPGILGEAVEAVSPPLYRVCSQLTVVIGEIRCCTPRVQERALHSQLSTCSITWPPSRHDSSTSAAARTHIQQGQHRQTVSSGTSLTSAQVWGQVEKIVGDLRATLGKRLRDTKRGLDEVEKTIESVITACWSRVNANPPAQNPSRIESDRRSSLDLLRHSASTYPSATEVFCCCLDLQDSKSVDLIAFSIRKLTSHCSCDGSNR